MGLFYFNYNKAMEKHYKPNQIEEKIYSDWIKNDYFSPREGKKNESFSITLPPPNITGSLHMGHFLNVVIQDSIIRYKRMQGYQTAWIPGVDHAGIAAQNVVEKQLKKEKKTRFDLGREKFVEKIWEWKEKSGGTIFEQLKKAGCSCDWKRARFTMDEDYVKAVEETFLHYYQKGIIYRGKRPINWCPKCQTSLSDLELEYEEEEGSLWYIKYQIKDSDQSVVVATTRPETMFGDTAVAVNPEDERYKNLVGKTLILPIVGKEIPIVADRLIDPGFGTGAVKVTPAHDFIDYQIGINHNLESVQVINEYVKLNENVPEKYQNMKIIPAREALVEELKEKQLIEKIEPYVHKIPKCYRCNSTVEVIPSWQWFVKMDGLAKTAIDAVKEEKIKFHPKRWENTYLNWLENIKDWCISRQLWWGHRIPVWFCQNHENEYFVSTQKPDKCPICGKCEPKQSEDVLDTWFSSALWPFAVFGWPKETEDLKKFYPTNVLSTARDIINLWVARMIYSSLELNDKIPFKDVIIHATVLTKDGRRMSKSLGTGIDPLSLIEKYGTDASRFGMAWQISDLQDIHFNEDHMMAGKKFCNKIWNASRFALMGIEEEKEFDNQKPQVKTEHDEMILKELNQITKQTTQNLDQYQFGKAVQQLYHFFWDKFCDIYIEKSKEQMQSEELKENTQKILVYTLATSLKLMHPFIPFITEEIYKSLPLKEKKALIIEDWPN